MRTLPVRFQEGSWLITPLLTGDKAPNPESRLMRGRSYALIRRYLVAAGYVPNLGSAQAVIIGESADRGDNGNLLLAKSQATSLPPVETAVSKVRRCSSTPVHARGEATDQFIGTASWVEGWMRFYSVMFESATVPLSLPSLRTGG